MITHRDQILQLLKQQIGNQAEVDDINNTADQVSAKWVKPLSDGKQETDGLLWGLIQSGKTGVLTVAAAIGADEGYRTIIILTTDNTVLYDQTLARATEAFPGMHIISKNDFKDLDAFLQRITTNRCCVIVTTKNTKLLGTLIENFKKGRINDLSSLIIDDEADQASLNTRARRDDGSQSTTNRLIATLRSMFDRITYLQVTATPQALFLQSPDHAFRPEWTVLSEPGADYVGGDDFFGDDSPLVREFPLEDIASLAPDHQPHATLQIPKSLQTALDTFVIAATFKRTNAQDQNSAFLYHVDTGKDKHKHVVTLLRDYQAHLAKNIKANHPATIARLKHVYDDLSLTHEAIRHTQFDELVSFLEFYLPGAVVKLVNGDTDEDVAVRSPLSLFVGGNKLGRGVTIKNLLVSYYGRNPKIKQSDTILQHARMYGYRRKDIGLLRLFLPPVLHVTFKAIHKMENSLRAELRKPSKEPFHGIYLEGGLSPTRKNVLAPDAIGVYSGGHSYNPAQVLRDDTVTEATASIDQLLAGIAHTEYAEMPIEDLQKVIGLTMPDESQAERVWNSGVVSEAIGQLATLRQQGTGYVYVARDRDLRSNRRETQGILTGGEADQVPDDRTTLFLLRINAGPTGHSSWWPMIRLPKGRYAFAFSI